MTNTIVFTLEIGAKLIVCVDGKKKRARLFAHGNGMEFYTRGKTAGRVDQCANVVMNKAIELTGTTRGVALARNGKPTPKTSSAQLKLWRD